MGKYSNQYSLMFADDDPGVLSDRKWSVADKFGFGTPKVTGRLDIQVLYVRVTSPPSAEVPEQLVLRCLSRDNGTALEVNGSRIIPSEEASLVLRRDRLDFEYGEVTYVSTEKVRIRDNISFDICHQEEPLVEGTLERFDSCFNTEDINGSSPGETTSLGWSMECSSALRSPSSVFSKKRHELYTGLSPSSLEVCVVGRQLGSPLILTQTVQLTPRKRLLRRLSLDVIPEGDESERNRRLSNRSVTESVKHVGVDRREHAYSMDGFTGLDDLFADNGSYSDGEDGEISWFNAGVRVGVGVGLGMCLGVGIGFGLMVRTYQATASSLRRKLL